MTTDNQMGSNSSNSDLFAEFQQVINDFFTNITGQFDGYSNALTSVDVCLTIVEQERAIDNAATKSAIATIERAATVKQFGGRHQEHHGFCGPRLPQF